MIGLQNLFHSKSNVEEIVSLILREHGVRTSQSTLQKRLLAHPDYPSLAAVNDVLSLYGMESVTLRTKDPSSLSSTKGDFLVQICPKEGNFLFGYVFNISQSSVVWYNPLSQKREITSTHDFFSVFTGYAMFFDSSNKIDEEHVEIKIKRERIHAVTSIVLLLCLPILALTSLLTTCISNRSISIWEIGPFCLLMLLGILLGLMLMLYEYNEYSPILRKICSVSKKTNCSAILHSPASTILGVPWTVVGTAYFTGLLAFVSASCFESSSLHLVAWFHLLALPYVAFSLCYQFFVSRQICPLCMGELAVIVALFLWLLLAGWYHSFPSINASTILSSSTCFFFAFTVLYLLWRLSLEYRSRHFYETSSVRLKLNREVFSAMLKKSRRVEMPTDDYGIIIGNPEGSVHIVKVCNPYCSHCADAQPILQQLARKNHEVKLHVIFAVNPDSDFYKETPIDSFLSLYNEGADIDAVLADWYASPDMDRKSLEQKYPTNLHDNSRNEENAKRMYQYCQEVGIVGTPTIFINGYELPKSYLIEDLLYCI